MTDLSGKLREAFQRKRYGSDGEYDPDFDLFDAAAEAIDRLEAELKRAKYEVSRATTLGQSPS